MVNIRAHWELVIERLKQYYDYLSNLYSRKSGEPIVFFNATIEMPVSIEIIEENKFSDYASYPHFFLEHYCYEVFIVMNLARPGICDFFNLSYNKSKIKLSSYNFQYAWELSFRGNIPKLKEIPLEKVIKWYRGINVGFKQKASKPIEKALFSLMHFCSEDGEINNIMWIFHALETLFSTRVGEGFSNLIDRISFLLALNPKDKSILKKHFRRLYDLRNSLIHGGYEIYHPMRYDSIDRSLEDQFSEMYDNLQFGVSIIIACLQTMITNSWYGIDITENINGKLAP